MFPLVLDSMNMRALHVTTQFATALVIAAVVPVLAIGTWASVRLEQRANASIAAARVSLATREAEHLGRNIAGAIAVLRGVAAELQRSAASVAPERLLGDYQARFTEFRSFALVDASGRVVGQGAGVPAPVDESSTASARVNGVAVTGIDVNGGTPQLLLSLPSEGLPLGATSVAGVLSLEQTWTALSQPPWSPDGYAMLATAGGEFIARGNPDARARSIDGHPLLRAHAPAWDTYQDDNRAEQFEVRAVVPGTDWTLIVSEPAAAAFVGMPSLGQQLAAMVGVPLVFIAIIGYAMRRRFIAPLVRLEHATRALADGRFDVRVEEEGSAEVVSLARSFNTMADRLVSLQASVRSRDRQVIFGRVVAGLFHDLSHPIQAIANNARLLLHRDVGDEERDAVARTMERELATLQRFMDDVLDVARPRPVGRVPVDVNASVSETLDAMRVGAERAGVVLTARYADDTPSISADRFALGRVFRNLVMNAIQATSPGGTVIVSTERRGDTVTIAVADTGTGIAPDRLSAIFDDFVTTKKRGLGLGLAISRRIVEQFGGAITVASQIGHGTTFTMRFPAAAAPSAIERADVAS